MNVRRIEGTPTPSQARALAEFEAQFRYPLGEGRGFRISHGADYARFFRALGEALCLVAERHGRVVGTVAVAIRRVRLPDGEERPAAYLGDLKIAPEARGGRALWALLRAAQQWAGARVDAAYCIVMDGTSATPRKYSGRAGIAALREVGRATILRLPTLSAEESAVDGTPDGRGLECFRRWSAGRHALDDGSPAARSETPPRWLTLADGAACGRLEDTLRAKRLFDADDGAELRSAHLSCFAFRDVRAGAALLRMALGCAARLGFPALFTSVSPADAAELQAAIGAPDAALSTATIYATGLAETASWSINTAEI